MEPCIDIRMGSGRLLHKVKIRDNRIGSGARRGQHSAFTLVEVLVVVAIIGLLASLLLPALAKAKGNATAIACRHNARQLGFGWILYADDHEGRLVPNLGSENSGWVSGSLDYERSNSDNTNSNLLLDPRYAKLGPYAKEARLFKCPSDASYVGSGAGRRARVRSVSMNGAVGGDSADRQWTSLNGAWRTFQLMSQIQTPSPASLWVFTEEHPDSVDDGRFTVDLARKGGAGYFHSWPANFHNEGAHFAYADGHAERKRWLDNRTKHENKYCGCLSSYAKSGYFTLMPGNVDLVWLQERTSSLLK